MANLNLNLSQVTAKMDEFQDQLTNTHSISPVICNAKEEEKKQNEVDAANKI
jgi:hypothetical protein